MTRVARRMLLATAIAIATLALPSLSPAQSAPHCPPQRPSEGASCGRQALSCAWSCGDEDSYDWTCQCARGAWHCTRGPLCRE